MNKSMTIELETIIQRLKEVFEEIDRLTENQHRFSYDVNKVNQTVFMVDNEKKSFCFDFKKHTINGKK
jgi:hypothetical protein